VIAPQVPISTNSVPVQAPTAVDASTFAAHANVAVKNEHVTDPISHQMEEDTQVLFDPEGYFNRKPSLRKVKIRARTSQRRLSRWSSGP
jgi:hypothetical protein